MKIRITAATLLLAALPLLAETPQKPEWIRRSDENSQILLTVLARFSPEAAGQFGAEGHDTDVTTLPADIDDRQIAALQGAIAQLQPKLAAEKDPDVAQDLHILIDRANQQIEETQLERKYRIPYLNVSQLVFLGERGLLDDRIAPARRPAALIRLRKYAGMEPGTTPITVQAMALTRAAMAKPNVIGPFKDNLTKDLANSDRFVNGIEQLYKKYGVTGYEAPLAELKKQIAAYNDFLRTELMPRATTDFRLPPELYAHALRSFGNDMAVEEMISRAKTSFREIQNEMQTVAPLVAKEKGFPSNDYRDVIRELKKQQVTGDAILTLYKNRIGQIETIIRDQHIVTLPQRAMVFRIASEAETANTPAPHFDFPRLLGNTGEMGAFVLPLRIPSETGKGDLGLDDFTFDAASWTLTAHEGRPGHELQFASVIEKGVSQARALFALNSVNAEGWGLYAEAEMQPYEPLDGQLIALQHRLMRAARAFLDPSLQLGRMSREDAFRVLEDQVVLSHALALEEVERYTFWAPGQAPSYFDGYSRLMELRADTERMLGKSFDRQSYHDFILSQGFVPPSLLREAVMAQYVKPRMAAAK